MRKTPTPAPPSSVVSPAAPVPKAALLRATATAFLALGGAVCFAALVMPAFGCITNFAWETPALLGLTTVWGWFLLRLCLRIARWVLSSGFG